MDLGSVGEAPKEEEEEVANSFVFDPNKEHYFAILIPVDKGSGAEVKAQASDFNNAFFESRNLRITSNLLSRTHQIVLVKAFFKPIKRHGLPHGFHGESRDANRIKLKRF